MREDNNRTMLWLIVAAVAVIAVVFFILWFVRGGDIDRLNRELRTARQSAEDTASRLDGDISRLRSDLSSASSRLSETESSLRAEKSRADRAESEASRLASSESELSGVRQRLREAEEKLKGEETRGADVAGRLEEALNALAATRDRVASLEQTNRELGNAWDRVVELEQTLAGERERAGDLNRRLQASATMIASAESDAALLARINGELESVRARLSDAEKAADAERRRAAELDARLARSAAALDEAGQELETTRNASELLSRTEAELADALAEIERLRTPGAETAGDNGDSVATINIMLKQQRERADQAHERAAEVAERVKILESELEKARLAMAAADEKSAADVRLLNERLDAARRAADEHVQEAARAERRHEALLAQARDEQAEQSRQTAETRKSLEAQIAKLKDDLAQANRTREQVTADLREGYEKRLAESQEGVEAARDRLAEIEAREAAAARLRDNLHEQLVATQKALADQKRNYAASAADAAREAAAAARLRENLHEQLSAARNALADQKRNYAASAADAAREAAAAARLRENLHEQLSAARNALADQKRNYAAAAADAVREAAAAARLRDNLHDQLSAARNALAEQKRNYAASAADAAKRAAAAARLRDNLQEQLAAAQRTATANKEAAAENLTLLTGTRNELEAEKAEAEKRRLDYENRLADSRRTLAERERAAKRAQDELNAELAALGSTIGSLEARIVELNRESGSQQASIRSLSARVRDLQVEVGEYAAVFGVRKPREVRRDIVQLGSDLAGANAAKAEIEKHLSEIQAQLDRYVTLLDGESPEEAAKRIDTLENLLDDLEATLAHYNDVLEGEKPEDVMALVRRLEATIENYKAAFGLERPGRFVGEIVDAMDHNRTLVLSLGAKDRVRAGMKFDVYRKIGDRNRHIGMVHVIRAYEKTSLAVATLRSEPVMVCPVTGFAVLEPGARFSPFAKAGDGGPLPLVEDGTLDIATEAPGIGDFINNPFYDAGKPLAFAVHDDASAGGYDAKKLAELLGGVPKDWKTATAVDFLVVGDGSGGKPVDGSWESHPARVNASYLARYYAPVGVITPAPPPPCPDPNCLPIRQ